jgi:ATP-binding cassette subfamily B protein
MKAYSLVRFFIQICKKPQKYIWLLVLTGLLSAATTTLLPYSLKMIIDDAGHAHHSIMNDIGIYLFIWLISSLTLRLQDWSHFRLGPLIRQNVTQMMFKHINDQSYSFFQNHLTGNLGNKIADMQHGAMSVISTCQSIYTQILTLVIATMALCFIKPIFSLIFILWILFFQLISKSYMNPIQKLATAFWELQSQTMGYIMDNISNHINVRLFAKEQEESHKVHKKMNFVNQKYRTFANSLLKIYFWWDLSFLIMLATNLFLINHYYQLGKITIGDLSFIVILSTNILGQLQNISEQLFGFSEDLGRCQQSLHIFNTPLTILDIADAKKLIIHEGQINFEKVHFNYNKKNTIFNDLTLQIEAGQKLGLVGYSGSGKTSFIHLILRFFEPQSGKIRIDGQAIDEVTQKSLHEQITVVPQDISLFHRSIMENIRYGKTGASNEEVIAAAIHARCHEFIMDLPKGYASLVGERGIKLSGGQRQRIGIARAILKNAPILILDEATSALDSESEQYIHEAFHEIMQGKTTIVIAHRLSTLVQMDKIIVFDKGLIIEQGGHESLLKQNGYYARLWKLQSNGFLPSSKI